MKETGAFPADSPIAYLYDGSSEGLLSAVFMAYERHEEPGEIVRERDYQPRLGQDHLVVRTDYDRAMRVRKGVERRAGRYAFSAVLHASASDDYETGTIVYRFIRHVMARPDEQRRHPVLDDVSNPCVSPLVRLWKHVSRECERMRQFIRFSQLSNGVWFARCNPNANVVPLVMGHFAARLNDQPFIIYDENHQVAGVHEGMRWSLVTGEVVDIAPATEHDELMKAAWQRFYDTLSVDARYNPELRRHFLPVRLWSNLPEMKPRPGPES